MKIIDLLNKIAKGEEVPYKIKYKGVIYEKDNDGDIDFYIGEDFDGTLLLEKLDDTNELNDEIEIIKEVEDKEYEDIEELGYKYINTYGNISQHRKSEEPLIDTINALIRNQKYILERVNKNE